MEKKGLGKRGVELAIGTIVIIILGLVVLVILIIGFTQGTDFFFGKFKFLPGQELEAVAQSCKIAANGNLKIDFCSFKEVEVDGEDEFVNCEDNRITSSLEGIGDDIDCVGEDSRSSEEKYCRERFDGDIDESEACTGGTEKKAIINEKVCCAAKKVEK